MSIKIITKVLSLSNTNSDEVKLSERNCQIIEEMQNEIIEFVKNKQAAKIQWLQSTGSVSEMLLQAKAIPFTHLTAVITW